MFFSYVILGSFTGLKYFCRFEILLIFTFFRPVVVAAGGLPRLLHLLSSLFFDSVTLR